MSSDEAHQWRERYRVLFERNVAGIILTNLRAASWPATNRVRGSSGLIPAMRCRRTALGIYIFTEWSVRTLLVDFEHEGIAPLRKFACDARMASLCGS
jgi:hypothetical protein